MLAQTGPGGVGNSTGVNGQPINRTWFRADLAFTLARTPSGKVTGWTDRSGNVLTAAQTDTSLAPVYVTGVVNNKAVVRFNGVPNARLTGNFNTSHPASPITVFAVARDFATSSAIGGVHTFSGFQGLYYENNQGIGKYVVDGNGANSTNTASTTSSTAQFRIISAAYSQANTNKSAIFMDGNREAYYTGSAIGTSAYTQFEIGGRTWGSRPNRIFNGDIAEVIAFGEALDSTKRIIVENYLSAKYNLAVANSKYAYWNTSYRNDLAGIGRAFDGSSHQEAASTVLTAKAPQTLANNRYMLFAHNNGSVLLGIAETPGNDAAFTRRSVREWRFDKSGGDLGTVTLQVDFTTLNSGVPAGFARGILIDQDGDFRAGATFIDLEQVGTSDVWEVQNVNIPDNYYLTIASIKRSVSFASTASSGFEDQVKYPVIQLKLNYPYHPTSTNAVTVSFSVTPTGTHPAAGPGPDNDINDFASSRLDVTLMPGETTADLNASATVNDATIEVHNDGQAEPNSETVKVTLTGATNAALGANTTFTYFINDDDFFRKIALAPGYMTSWPELEAGAFLDTALLVQLPSGQTGGPTTVDLVVTGPAKAGMDYRFLDAPNASDSIFQVIIPTGERMARVRIRLYGDNTDEDNEPLFFQLQDPRSGTLSQTEPTTHTLTIVDNDAEPEIGFLVSSALGAESVNLVRVQVRLSRRSGKAIALTMAINPASTALGPENDYELITPSPVYFSPGDSVAYLDVTVVDDDIEEEDETVIIDLVSAVNATLISPQQFIYRIIDNDIYGASGPGGVDKSDGAGTLAVWLRADKGITLTSGKISAWADQSGNSFNAAQATASKRPLLLANTLNGQPAVRFQASSRTNMTGTILPVERTFPLQFMMVARDNGTTSALGGVFNTNRWAGFYSNAGQQYVTDAFSGAALANATPANSANTAVNPAQMQAWNIVTNQYQKNSTENSSIWMNGVLEEHHTGPGVEIQNHSSYFIGSRYNPEPSPGVYNYFTGDVAEVIFFTTDLNEARRIIIENYLSAKYSLPIANDRYSGHAAEYVQDVAGIGSSDGTAANKHRVASSAGLYIRQAGNSLDNANEFLMFGHASAGNGIDMVTIGTRPMEMWIRNWYLAKTGAMDVTLTFDHSEAGVGHAALPVNEYDLLYRSSPIAAWGVVTATTNKTLTGDRISFSLSNAALVNGYYTIGRTDPEILPVEFSLFEVRAVGKEARLRWTTASEQGSSHFEVERTADLSTWEMVGTVQAAGKSNANRAYAFSDNSPMGGTSYYRLRQVDLDGTIAFSPVRQVRFDRAGVAGFGKLTVYPNPARSKAKLAVEGSDATAADVSLTDALGRVVLKGKAVIQGGNASIDLSRLSKGVYSLRVGLNTGEVHIRSLAKE